MHIVFAKSRGGNKAIICISIPMQHHLNELQSLYCKAQRRSIPSHHPTNEADSINKSAIGIAQKTHVVCITALRENS
jgi:hypothetical protein